MSRTLGRILKVRRRKAYRMKAHAENPAEPSETRWCFWIPACMMTTLILYLASALATRVMWEHGTISQGSATYHAVVIFYRPLDIVAAASPRFKSAFKACVDWLVPDNRDGNWARPPNPQGGANGGQPSRSETNRTSSAAASRRSP